MDADKAQGVRAQFFSPGAVLGEETFLRSPAVPMAHQVYATATVSCLCIQQHCYEHMVRPRRPRTACHACAPCVLALSS